MNICFAFLLLVVTTVLSESTNCTASCHHESSTLTGNDSCVQIYCNGVPGSICCSAGHMATCHCVTKYGPPACTCS